MVESPQVDPLRHDAVLALEAIHEVGLRVPQLLADGADDGAAAVVLKVEFGRKFIFRGVLLTCIRQRVEQPCGGELGKWFLTSM